MQRLGFVGLGNLGRHLAASLLDAGYPLTVNDRDEAVAQPLVEAGAIWAASPKEVAAASDTVFTCLPSPKVVADVLCGESGLLAGFAPGATWIDSSTNDRHELERLATLAAARGVSTLEAPVTGGVHLAASGQITVLVGGDEDVFIDHLPAFEAIGGKVFYIGPLGSASVIKVITNMLAFIHLVAAGEALMLAKRGGLDLAQSFEVIKASSGTSFVHETESQVILNGSYDIGFTIDLACKDLGFAQELGEEFGVPLELASLVQDAFLRAREEYGGSAWSPMVVKLLEDAVGTELRAPGFPAQIQRRCQASACPTPSTGRYAGCLEPGVRRPEDRRQVELVALVRVGGGDGLVELDPEARRLRGNDVAVLPFDRGLQDLGVKAAPVPDSFEHEEVRAAGAELDVCRADDRPAVEVRRDLGVVRLGHAGDLLRLEQAADASQVQLQDRRGSRLEHA